MTREEIYFVGGILTFILAGTVFIWKINENIFRGTTYFGIICFIGGIITFNAAATNGVAQVPPPPPPKQYYEWKFENKSEIKNLRRTTTERISQRGSSSYDQYQFLVKGETNGEISWSEDELPFFLNKIVLVEQERDNYVLEHNKAYCFIEGKEDEKHVCSIFEMNTALDEYIIYGPIGFTDTIGPPISTD